MFERIMQYESEGFETEEELVEFFVDLYKAGLLSQLQGHYGRTFKDLWDTGLISEAMVS